MSNLFGRFEKITRKSSLYTSAIPTPMGGLHPFDERNIHPKLANVVRKLFDNSSYTQAAYEAYKCLDEEIRRISCVQKSGVELMVQVFSQEAPHIILTGLSNEHEKDEQTGYQYLFTGAMLVVPSISPNISSVPGYTLPHNLNRLGSDDSILIVTVTKVETQAVRKVFAEASGNDWIRHRIRNKTYYDLGVHGEVKVYMVQSEMGSVTPGGALTTVIQAIDDLKPQAVIMCGIAFGMQPDKQKIGDILVARQLEYYEPEKVDLHKGHILRGDRATASIGLLDRFRSGDHDWQGAQVHFGLVLSGEKLINDPDFRNFLLQNEQEAIGGEMEGAGLYAAARHLDVEWILVKSICDWADGNKNSDSQTLAANNAAQFVIHVLRLGGWDRIGQKELSVSPKPQYHFKEQLSPDKCLDHLSLVSLLLRRLEEAGYKLTDNNLEKNKLSA